MAGGSEITGERLRRAAFGPQSPPNGEAKYPDFGPKVQLRPGLRTMKVLGRKAGGGRDPPGGIY